MTARDAPEPRDVIWENVFLPNESVTRRKWVIEIGLGALTIFWATIVTFCASSAILADKLFGFDPESTAWAAVAAILPILVLLSILNLPVDLPDDRALLRAAQVPFGGRLVSGRAFFPISICQ